MAGAALVVVALLSWGVFSLLHPGRSEIYVPVGQGVAGKTTARPAGRAEVRPVLLADYYEHGIEHAPPRDPSGCMQRREHYYTAPPDPLVLARAQLKNSTADTELLKWLESRRAGYLAGRSSMPAERQPLEGLLPACSLSAENLLDIGRAFAFLEGDQLAACWYEAGIAKAEIQYRDTPPGDSSAKNLLHLLDQTKALWRLKDYKALEKRFGLATRLNVPLSAEARRPGYLHAEMIFYQHRSAEAANAIMAVQSQHEQVGDLDVLQKGDIQEMHWVLGLFLARAGRHAEAIPHFSALAQDGKSGRQQAAMSSLVISLAGSGRFAEADEWLAQYAKKYGSESQTVTTLVLLLDDCKAGRRKGVTTNISPQ